MFFVDVAIVIGVVFSLILVFPSFGRTLAAHTLTGEKSLLLL